MSRRRTGGDVRNAAGADSRRKGFTLLEVMCATIILSLGLVALLTAFMQCQRIMRTTQGFETAQYVLMLGETLYPLPDRFEAPQAAGELLIGIGLHRSSSSRFFAPSYSRPCKAVRIVR